MTSVVTGSEVRPRPHQERALADLASTFERFDRAQVIMACGTGKTLVACWAADRQQSGLTLVVVPSLSLVAQTLRAWRQALGSAFSALVICSDPTTAAGEAERAGADGGDVDGRFWAGHRARVTTEVSVVQEVLGRLGDGPLVVFSTYHSAWVAAEAARQVGCWFDMLVADEAHHLAGAPREDFRVVLDAAALPARRRLFLTATQVCARGQGLLSMGDEALFGPVAHRLDFAEAIRQELLADYEVVVFEAEGESTPDSVAALVAGADGLHSVLTFHGRVAKARGFAAAVDGAVLPDGRRVVAVAVAGTDPDARRRRALQLLAEPRADRLVVVSSARCLAEGVDIPAVDGVLFADPKQSDLDIVQAAGRALRRAPGKDRGRVLVPVCIPPGLDDDTVLSTSVFAPVWRVLRGLRTLDSRLAVELTTVARGMSRRGQSDGSRPSLVRWVLPSIADLARVVARAVDATSPVWERTFAELQTWTAEHGVARPPRGTALGEWCERQRTSHRRGLLPAERAALLRGLPGWAWDLAEQRWLDQWAQVTKAARRAGRLPVGDGLAMGQHLRTRERGGPVRTVGQWCAWQRQLQRRGDLEVDRRRRLEEIPGWRWQVLPPVEEACVDLLADYTAWRGDADPPAGYVDDGQPVGRWLNQVRRRRVTGQLEQPLADELEVISGTVGSGSRVRWYRAETLWLLGVEALRQFVGREGSVRVPDGHVELLPDIEIPLSEWCRRQRHAHRYGGLSDPRAELLEQVPGWRWEVEPGPRVLLDIGDARHGSRTGYVKGCRCTPCTDANTADHAHRSERVAAGEASCDWVPAAPARAHLRILAGQGAETKPLARAAGLNIKTINGLLDGSTVRIHPGTEAAALAVTLTDVRAAAEPGTRVPAGPTWQLLEEMLRLGWPKTWIARELSMGKSLQLARTTVTAENARRVEELHHRLGRRRPPPRQKGVPTPPLAQIEAETKQTAA